MAVVYLKLTSGSPQTWPASAVPPPGTIITAEAWGAASGGSGSSTSFRAGGAAGAYATSPYVVTPNDYANGITYTVSDGSPGTGAANSTPGPDTSWSTNNLNLVPTTSNAGAAIGIVGADGSFPANWNVDGASFGSATGTIVGFGTASNGIPYVDIRIAGTVNTANAYITFTSKLTDGYGQGAINPMAASTQYTASVYAALIGGSLSNFSSINLTVNTYNASTYVDTPITVNVGNTLNSTYTRFSGTATTIATAITRGNIDIELNWTNPSAVDLTLRLGGVQVEIAAAASFWKSTPGYVLAKGGGATSGTTGGVGGLASACVPAATAFNGGSGATRTQGGGGGGASGPKGAGTSATTGTGATGNNGTVAAGISSTEAGGGATAGTAPTAGGSPGGGGAGNTSTGNGSAGGQGQIRLSWADIPAVAERAPGLAPFRTGPGRGPRPLVPQPWRGDFSPPASDNAVIVQTQDDQTSSITATIGAEPIAARSPFRLLPGRGPRPLVPQPWRFNFPADAHAVVVQTQDDQTVSITASVSAEPIAARSPFRLLPGKGPRPLVPQPWRYYVQNANAVVTATQDDQTAAAAATNLDHAAVVQTQDDQIVTATATVGAEPIASRSPFRLLPGRGPRPLVPQPWRYYVQNADATVTATQDDQTSSITATIGAEPIAVRSPFRLLPGRGPRPLVPQPWRGDFTSITITASNAVIVQTQDDQTAAIATTNLDTAIIVQTQDDQTITAAATNLDRAAVVQTQDDQTVVATSTVGAQPVASRSPFRLLPGRGPRPLVPQPWRYYVQNANAVVIQTQADQTVSIAATNSEHVAIVQTQDDQTASITATSLDHAAINQTQDDQTAAIITATSSEPIAARSPFRLLPGRGPRPLVPQPWRYYVPLANAAIVQTQDDQTASVVAANLGHAAIVQTQDDQTAAIAAANLDHAVVVQTQDDQTASIAATNLDHAAIAQTQDDQTSSITASIGAVPIAARSPFRLLPGRGPRPLVPNPWRYVVQADLHGSIVQTQDDQTISAAALLTHVADIDQNQDDQTISSTAALLAAAVIAQTQSNQTIVSAATNRTHAAIVQTQDDQAIVATALLLVPRTATIIQTQQDQTIHMAAGLPRVTVAQPQFLW